MTVRPHYRCSYCREPGHYTTTCVARQVHEAIMVLWRRGEMVASWDGAEVVWRLRTPACPAL